MDIEDAIRNPSVETISTAALSTAGDILGLSAIKGAIKAAKLANNIRKASKAVKRTEALPEVKKAYSILGTKNLSPRKYARARATLDRSGHTQNLTNLSAARYAQYEYENAEILNGEIAPYLVKKAVIPAFSDAVNGGQQFKNIMQHIDKR